MSIPLPSLANVIDEARLSSSIMLLATLRDFDELGVKSETCESKPFLGSNGVVIAASISAAVFARASSEDVDIDSVDEGCEDSDDSTLGSVPSREGTRRARLHG